MGFSLSGGPYEFNRFDAYEQALEEGEGASTPQKMEKAVEKAGKKSKVEGKKLAKIDSDSLDEESFWIEDEEGNIYEGKKDACYHKVKSRYDVWPSAYASGALVKCRKKGAANWGNSSKKEMYDDFGHEYVLNENRFAAYGGKDTDAGSEYAKPNNLKMGKIDKYAQGPVTKDPKMKYPNKSIGKYKKEEVELNNEETGTTVMEQEQQRMAMYSRALGVMGAQYSGTAPAEDKEVAEAAKPDYLDFDKDGDKKEPMKKALKEKSMKKEETELTKEDVVAYLLENEYADNEVSAEILHTHMSDEFLAEIEGRMLGEDAE